MRSALVIITLMAMMIASAQDSLARYKFINTAENRLVIPADSSTWVKFYDKVQRLETEKNQTIRIVHIGGSHVQGGMWSNTFITQLQAMFNTHGGGYFVFPYRMGRTNSPSYSRSFTTGKWKLCRSIGREFCLPLGMSALSLTTRDSALNFGITLTDKARCRQANIIRVYHNFSSSYRLNLAGINHTRTDNEAQGCSVFSLETPVDSLVFELVRTDTSGSFTLYGISMENNTSGGFYLGALGANGASTGSFLRCSEFPVQVGSLTPDLVIISLGVNDTQSKGFKKETFIDNYDSLITIIRKVAPAAAIILTTTTDNYVRRKNSNKRTVPAREAMMELMNKHNVAVWDLFTVMGGYKSMTKWYKAGLASRDKVHFNGKGYAIVGNLMFTALINARRNFITR
jgi:lysophospholipase L1-like esterase